MSIILHIVNHT